MDATPQHPVRNRSIISPIHSPLRKKTIPPVTARISFPSGSERRTRGHIHKSWSPHTHISRAHHHSRDYLAAWRRRVRPSRRSFPSPASVAGRRRRLAHHGGSSRGGWEQFAYSLLFNRRFSTVLGGVKYVRGFQSNDPQQKIPAKRYLKVWARYYLKKVRYIIWFLYIS